MKYRLYRRTPAAWDHSGISWYTQAFVDTHDNEHCTGWSLLPELNQQFLAISTDMANYHELIAISDVPFTYITHPELFL